MTEGYPGPWQQDVQADPITTGSEYPAFAVTGASYRETTTYDATEGATAPEDHSQGKAGAAKEQAAAVGQGAAQAGQQVASVAKDQVQHVAAEAGSQAKDLLGQARSELTEQAGAQQKRLIETLRSLGDELESMGHHSQEPGMATDLVKQASGRAHDAASWLESREPGSLVSELQGFARQRPGAFLALAAAAGLAAGRLGRGVKDASSDADSASTTGAGTTVTPSAGALSYAPEHLDEPVEPTRPFASSQDSDYREYPSGGAGL